MSDYRCTGHHANSDACQQENACSCPPVNPCPPACPDNDGEDCSCRRGFVQTLQMLLRTGLSSLVDFQAFAFVTPDFVVGSPLTAPEVASTSYDNLAGTLTGVFSRFTHCACDYIDASGPVYLPITGAVTPTGLTVSRLNLCDLIAVAFEVVEDTTEPVTDNYQTARRMLQGLLQRDRRDVFPPYPDPCENQGCCQWNDTANAGGSVSLIAGPLLLANVVVLGSIGGVMVLANDTDERFYFVCSDDAAIIR